MPPFDYSDPPPSKFEPKIPEGTKTTVVIHVKQGGVGEDQMLTRSKDGGCEMLAVVFTVADGAYKGEKFPENWVLEGTTDGHAKAGQITRRKLKAILDSAFGLDPNDKSPEARARRTISLGQLEGMAFMAEIGIEKGSGDYSDKNIVAGVITKDKKDWHREKLMGWWGKGGRRPMGWWAYEAREMGLRFPGQAHERSALYEFTDVLSADERVQLEAEWRKEFDRSFDEHFFYTLEPGKICSGDEARWRHWLFVDLPPPFLDKLLAERERRGRVVRDLETEATSADADAEDEAEPGAARA